MLALVGGLAWIAGCSSLPPVPTPVQVFEPDPNYNFHASTGEVQITALAGHTVCYTTDGSEPAYANGTCTGGTTAAVPTTNRITLRCGSETSAMSIRGVKVAFDWPGRDGPTVATVAGNFTLDCTQPEPDGDADGVPDNVDNCPTTSNADQADSNMNGIGNACEAAGAPDADADGRPDSADNCAHVWNVNQGDDDHDGIGNVCDPTPRGDPPLPWDNSVLARAFVAWKDEIQCRMNGCRNPGGTGSWNLSCDGGTGTVDWNVGLSGLRAISTFTYHGCLNTVTVNVHDYVTDPHALNPAATVPLDVTLTVDGSMVQDTDFGGSGSESGTVTVSGSFTGTVASHVQIGSALRTTGSYFAVACSADPIAEEACAPSNLLVNYVYPDWTCEPGGCPA
ncbi:MAG: thrombospondin type 3 repeat-containing protein, partial [Deltaproteobacteria bacterium]